MCFSARANGRFQFLGGEIEGIEIEENVYQSLLQKYPEQDKSRLFCEKHAMNFRHVEVDKAD